jgi:hypothetical protein
MDEVGKALGLASAFYDDLQTVMDSLAEQEVTSTYATGFIEALIPAEKDPATGKIATRTANTRDTLSDLFANGMGNNGRTKWDLFNAVTEYVDHHQVGRITGSRLEKSNDSLAIIERDARFERSILGAGAVLKQKAMDLLLN